MFTPHRERLWVTLRAAFGRKSATRSLVLQVQAANEGPPAFRVISNLTADHSWQCEGTFPRSDLAYRAYLTRRTEARLTDYFQQPPKRTPPRWLIPSPEGLSLTAPVDQPSPDHQPCARPTFWRKLWNNRALR